MSRTHQEAPFLHLWAHFTVQLKVDVALQRAQEWHLWPRAVRLNNTSYSTVQKSWVTAYFFIFYQENKKWQSFGVCARVWWLILNYIHRLTWLLSLQMHEDVTVWMETDIREYELRAFLPSPKQTGSSQLKPGWACMLQSEQSYWCEPHWGLQDWPQLQQHTSCLLMTSDTGGNNEHVKKGRCKKTSVSN